MWKLNNILLTNHLVKEKVKRDIKKYLETNKSGNNTPKLMRCSTNSSKRVLIVTKAYITKDRK